MKKILFVDYCYVQKLQNKKYILDTAIQEVVNHNRDPKNTADKIDIVIIPDSSILDIVNAIDDSLNKKKENKSPLNFDLIKKEIVAKLEAAIIPEELEIKLCLLTQPTDLKKYNEILKKIIKKFENLCNSQDFSAWILSGKSFKEFLMQNKEIDSELDFGKPYTERIQSLREEKKILSEESKEYEISTQQINYYVKEKQILHTLKNHSDSKPKEKQNYIAFLLSDKDLIFNDNISDTAKKGAHLSETIEESKERAKEQNREQGRASLYYFKSVQNKNGGEIIENIRGLINGEFEREKIPRKLENMESIYSLIAHTVSQLGKYVKEKGAESQSLWSFFTDKLYRVNHSDMLKVSDKLWEILSKILKNLDEELRTGIAQPLEFENFLSETEIQDLLQSMRLKNIPDLINYCVNKKIPDSGGSLVSGWKTQLQNLDRAFQAAKKAAALEQSNVHKACIL